MKHWPTKPLEEIADLYGGSTPSRQNPAFWGGDIPWVTPTDLPMPDEGISVVNKTKDRITQAGLDSSSATLIPKGAVLFSSRATIGKVAVADMPLATNQGFANFVPHSKIISRFLAYALWVRREDIARLSGSTTFKEVSRSTLRKYQLPVPPLAEQERIVKLLDAADALRKLRAQADHRTNDLLPALLNDTLGAPGKYAEKKLDSVCEFITKGTTPIGSEIREAPAADDIPFVKVYHITDNGGIDFSYRPSFISRTLHESTLRRSRVYPGDVLMNIVGPPLGRIGLVPSDYPEWNVNQALAIFRPRAELLSSYLLHALRSSRILPTILNQAVGVRQLNLSLEQCRNATIPLPPIPVQQQFAATVTEICEFEAEQTASHRRLNDLFQSMLHRAFRGEL